MNETSATSQSGVSLLPEGIGALTTVHFVVLALFALAVVAMIVAGIRRKRVRTDAAHQVARHAEEAGVAPPPPESIASAPSPATAAERSVPEPAPLADEPIAAAAPMAASPASEAATEPAVSPSSSPADGSVTQLKGLGPKVSATLAGLGVTTVGQLAALDDTEAAALDTRLGPFRGRMMRDRWVEQARFLAAGDRAGFEAVFGKL